MTQLKETAAINALGPAVRYRPGGSASAGLPRRQNGGLWLQDWRPEEQ